MKVITRADSIQNKETIIKAALDLFRVKGVDIPLTEIAKEAQVSRMTFYRHFPDRNAIVLAVFLYNLDQLNVYGQELSGKEDAFYLLLKKVLMQRVEYHSFLPYIDKEGQVLTSTKMVQIFETPIRIAKKNGSLRADFCGERDLLLLISMMGAAVSSIAYFGQAAIDRTMELIMNGIKVSQI